MGDGVGRGTEAAAGDGSGKKRARLEPYALIPCYEYCVYIQEGPMGNIYREYKGGCHIQIRKYKKESYSNTHLKLMVGHTH